jgi:hypothetical protein
MLAVVAGELVFEDVVVAVVATIKFDDVLVDIAVSVELLDKQLIALDIVTPKSPQACRTYLVAVTLSAGSQWAVRQQARSLMTVELLQIQAILSKQPATSPGVAKAPRKCPCDVISIIPKLHIKCCLYNSLS